MYETSHIPQHSALRDISFRAGIPLCWKHLEGVMMKANEGHRRRVVAIRAIALFAVVAVVFFVTAELAYRSQLSNRLDAISQSTDRVLDLQREIIHGELGSIASDLLFLANQNELHSYLETEDETLLDELADEYLAMAQEKTIYDQIRFLDELGMEIVRVDFNQGEPAIVARGNLQPKGGRYYFLQTIILDNGEVYVSPFDLNIEQGIVEAPRKPVIRFATPIYDAAGLPQGIVILNYLGMNLFEALGRAIEGSEQRTFLANWEGHWLWGPDPSVEWGFVIHGAEIHTVDTSFPGTWGQLTAVAEGRFRTNVGLFTFTTIHPMDEAAQTDTSPDHEMADQEDEEIWKLISFVPAGVLSAVETPLRRLWRITQGLVILLSAGISWFYARFRVLRAEYRSRIEYLAKHDSLTGTCNRHYFEESITNEEMRARRYKHPISFLMVDITRFKQINDTYGHKVGDEVLQEVAAILKANVREVDAVVRYGGDEFLIMFPETPGEADAARRRILAAIDELNTTGAKFGFPVILALGSAHWDPGAGMTIEDVLSYADERMYEHKRTQH